MVNEAASRFRTGNRCVDKEVGWLISSEVCFLCLCFWWFYLDEKFPGKHSAGNPHVAFEVAGVGNVAWSRYCDTHRRKGEITANTNFDLNWRACSRHYW